MSPRWFVTPNFKHPYYASLPEILYFPLFGDVKTRRAIESGSPYPSQTSRPLFRKTENGERHKRNVSPRAIKFGLSDGAMCTINAPITTTAKKCAFYRKVGSAAIGTSGHPY